MSARKHDWSKVTTEDILNNPHAFGLPTFEEFSRSAQLRDKLVGRKDSAMIALTQGPEKFRKYLKRIRFFVNGLELASEEEVEKALGDYGYTHEDIDLTNRNSKLKKRINLVPVGGGLDHDVYVHFLP